MELLVLVMMMMEGIIIEATVGTLEPKESKTSRRGEAKKKLGGNFIKRMKEENRPHKVRNSRNRKRLN